MKHNKNSSRGKKFFLYSFTVHLIILALFLMPMHSLSEIKVSAKIPIYFATPSIVAKNNSPTSEKKSSKIIKRVMQHSQTKSTLLNATRTKSTLPLSELLALLHAAIQQQQHYPKSALLDEQEGRVTLAFTLLVNGSIEHLRIIKSSGILDLDEAALTATRGAVPFAGIQTLISQPQECQLDVVFELT